MRIRARFLLSTLCAVTVLLAGSASGFAEDEAITTGWTKYRDRFVTEEGRVLDTGNNKVSHTEGQGWAMLFAEAAGDQTAFGKVWDWTRNTLQRHDNALFSWRWDPAGGKAPISDRNDATDGDILIAWALLRAGDHWNLPEYTHAARQIVADIKRHLLVRASGRLMLLPGESGFKNEDGVTTINPSYYIFPAFKDFARVLPSPEWQRLRRDGLDLLADSRFGRWGLNPDWIDLHGIAEPALSAKFPARFGFEAIRIPLYLIWGREASSDRLASCLDFWNGFGDKPIPAWTDLNDNTLAPYAGSTGFQAIIRLARGFGQSSPAALPPIADADDYYAASLTLLAAVAQREAFR